MSPASFGRRLGAALYDVLVLFAVLMLATALFMLINRGAAQGSWQRLAYQIYLLAVCVLYFGGFWVRGGQTVGMLAWKITAVSADGGKVRWPQALIRFAASLLSWGCLGLGFFWALVDRDRLAWHDRLSGTRLMRVDRR